MNYDITSDSLKQLEHSHEGFDDSEGGSEGKKCLVLNSEGGSEKNNLQLEHQNDADENESYGDLMEAGNGSHLSQRQ